jgi:group I intron endonuclease
METVKYTIYKLIDPNTRQIRYIGLTFNDLKLRLKSHISEPGKSHKIHWIKKLKKQGIRPIIESIEEDISTFEEACEREIYYIDYFRSLGCDLTNMNSGGNKNKRMSEESRKKMSESHKKRHETLKLEVSEKTKELIRKSTIERFKNPEEREKLKISNKRYEDSKTPEQKLNDILSQNCKKVYQYDKEMKLIESYPSVREAERRSGINRANINKCCKHKVLFVGGYIWRFEGDITSPKYKNRKEVIQIDLNGNFISEFENIRKASLDTNVSDSSIRKCCKENTGSAGGFIWKYKDTITLESN